MNIEQKNTKKPSRKRDASRYKYRICNEQKSFNGYVLTRHYDTLQSLEEDGAPLWASYCGNSLTETQAERYGQWLEKKGVTKSPPKLERLDQWL